MAEPKTENKINKIPMREAESKEEKLLLGFLHQEVERVQFGQIVVEFTIKNGVITYMKSNEISRTFNVGSPGA